MDAHRQEVGSIALKVQEYYKSKESFRIQHGSTNTTRPIASRPVNMINTSRLANIIRVDKCNKSAVVEANVAMDTLLEETLKHDLMPLVMTEFPGITVGGAFSGTAGESSSFKHGYFDHTVSEVEIVLANGGIITCSETKNEDLFKGSPGALGTLGVVTLLHIRLQKASRFVEITYHPLKEAREAVDHFRTFATQDDDSIHFLDGIMFSKTKGAIITGRLADSNPTGLPIQRFIRPRDPWYFTHVESRINSSPLSPTKELVPLPDYIFRYNRGIFWLGKQTLDILGINSSPTARRFTHHAFTARMGYARVHMQPVNTMLIQDLAIPFPAAEEFMQWSDERFGIYPLWLCPLRVPSTSTMHPHPLDSTTADDKVPDLMLNVGLYSVAPKYYDDWVTSNHELEDKVAELGGMKWAYAAQMYSEDKFWEQHDRESYDRLREKYYATSLPTIYDKTKVDIEAGRRFLEDREAQREKTLIGRNCPHLLDLASFVGDMIKSIRGGAWKLERSSAWYEWPEP